MQVPDDSVSRWSEGCRKETPEVISNIMAEKNGVAVDECLWPELERNFEILGD
jgi:hypothetical protein